MDSVWHYESVNFARVSQKLQLPATHNVAISAKDLSKTTDNNVRVVQHMDVEKISDGFIDDDRKVIAVGKRPKPAYIRCLEEWVAWEFAEQCKKPLPAFAAPFDIVNVVRGSVTIKHATRTPFLQDFQSVNVWESRNLDQSILSTTAEESSNPKQMLCNLPLHFIILLWVLKIELMPVGYR